MVVRCLIFIVALGFLVGLIAVLVCVVLWCCFRFVGCWVVDLWCVVLVKGVVVYVVFWVMILVVGGLVVVVDVYWVI